MQKCAARKKGKDFSPIFPFFSFIIKKAKFQGYCEYDLNTPKKKKSNRIELIDVNSLQ